MRKEGFGPCVMVMKDIPELRGHIQEIVVNCKVTRGALQFVILQGHMEPTLDVYDL